MGGSLAAMSILFDDRVRDAAAKIAADERTRAIEAALLRYSQVRPRVQVKDYPGDGIAFDFELPLDWAPAFSTIPDARLEYPAGERVPVLLDRDDWTFYQSPSGVKLRLLSITPAAGKTLRVPYTVPHTIDLTGSTVPPIDDGAVADLAAAIGLRQLAAAYANTSDPTIQADVVNYRTKSQEYTTLADKLETAFRKHLGLDQTSEGKAASAFTDDDQEPAHRLGRLTHPDDAR